jgi:hypothetical protein
MDLLLGRSWTGRRELYKPAIYSIRSMRLACLLAGLIGHDRIESKKKPLA